LSGFLCLSFFAAAKKVSAAPHRGNTNRPISIQGKAKNQLEQMPKSQSKEGQKQTPTTNNRRTGKKKNLHLVRQIKQRVSPPLRSKKPSP
jgi:hypothetical protein